MSQLQTTQIRPIKADGETFLRKERREIRRERVQENLRRQNGRELGLVLSRVILSDIMLKIKSDLGLRPFLTVHDSLSYLVAEADAEWVAKAMIEIAEKRPTWWEKGAPPIAVAAKIGDRYGSLETFKPDKPQTEAA